MNNNKNKSLQNKIIIIIIFIVILMIFICKIEEIFDLDLVLITFICIIINETISIVIIIDEYRLEINPKALLKIKNIINIPNI